MEKSLLNNCILNNAYWCNLVSSHNNTPGKMNTDVWLNHNTVPTYYPNVITLKPITNIDRYIVELSNYLKSSWAVKDSYNSLHLDANTFTKLFDAKWVYKKPSPSYVDSNWKIIQSSSDLLSWEQAWKKSSPTSIHIFKKDLLDIKDVVFMGKYKENNIVAGVIAYNNSNVIGVSNFFSDNYDSDFIESTNKIQFLFPNSTLVYYDSAEHLDAAYKAGYTYLGDLSVWLYSIKV